MEVTVFMGCLLSGSGCVILKIGSGNRNLTKECDGMKNTILRIVSIVFVLMTILAIACAITVTGSGFLDLSNIARTVCIGVAVVCGILAFIAWKCTMPKD